jgi:hypothetical protein
VASGETVVEVETGAKRTFVPCQFQCGAEDGAWFGVVAL